MEKTTKKWYFTFGFGQPHEGRYCVIESTSYDLARKRMIDKFGLQWSMQYDEDGWFDEEGVSQAEKYDLKEIK